MSEEISRGPRRVAAVLTGVQSLALLGFAVFYLYELASGEGSDPVRVVMSAVLIALFGVSVFGRVLVPINFRLKPDEIRYIIEHSGSTVLLFDPEHEALVRDIPVVHRIALGEASDERLFLRPSASPRYFQLAMAFPCGDPGPNSNISILMPFGSVAFATDESSCRTRGSSTVTPRCFRDATAAFKSATCNPKWFRPGGRVALARCSSTNVLRLTCTYASVACPCASRTVNASVAFTSRIRRRFAKPRSKRNVSSRVRTAATASGPSPGASYRPPAAGAWGCCCWGYCCWGCCCWGYCCCCWG